MANLVCPAAGYIGLTLNEMLFQKEKGEKIHKIDKPKYNLQYKYINV